MFVLISSVLENLNFIKITSYILTRTHRNHLFGVDDESGFVERLQKKTEQERDPYIVQGRSTVVTVKNFILVKRK